MKIGAERCSGIRRRAPSDIEATLGAHPGAPCRHDSEIKQHDFTLFEDFVNVRFRYDFLSKCNESERAFLNNLSRNAPRKVGV